MNLISDTKSRKLALLGCLTITIFAVSSIFFIIFLVTLIGGWLNSVAVIIISQFIQGFGTSSVISLSYAFLSDYCSNHFKPRAVIIVNTAW